MTAKEMSNHCAWPGCKAEGEFRAPAHPRDLRRFQYFCAEHIKEFNKRWNGLNGFSEDEIFSMQHGGATWNRPTWNMGTQAPTAGDTAKLFQSAEELYRFFKHRKVNDGKVEKVATQQIPADVKEACSIFDVETPIGGKELKQKYLKLVKTHHPDTNPDNENAEDTIKRINVAYRILEDYAEIRSEV